MDGNSFVEAASPTVPRPGIIQIDAVDGFGHRSEVLIIEAALTSKEAAEKGESTFHVSNTCRVLI